MPSCEIFGSRFAARLTYNLSQDIGGNYSVVRITRVELKSLQSMPTTECWVTGSISVNGANACNLELTDTTSCSVTMSQSYDGGGEGNGWFSGFSTRDIVVGHGEDGNGGFSVYASLDVIMTNQIGLDPGIRNSAYVSLPQIPRVSTISAGGVVLGQKMTIKISRASSAFSDTVTWRCGSRSGTIAEKTTASELKWTPPVDLAAQVTDSTAVPIVLTIQTFVGGSQVGSREIGVSCTVPDSVVPTVSAVVSDRMGYASRYGGYVQTQSQARVVTTAAGVYGSTIRSIAVRCGSLTGSGADVSFALGESGQIPITVTVTDSRGRTAQWSSSINVLAYRKPQAAVTQAYRCDSKGTPQPNGVWLRVVFKGSVTALNGNGATYRGICRVHGGEDERSVLLADYSGKTSVTGGSFLLTAGLDSSYDCFVTVQDNFCTVQSPSALVSVAFALLDFDRADKAVGIGMRAKNPGKLSIGLDTDMEEHRIGNLLDPAGNQDAATKAYVDAGLKRARCRNLLDNSDFRNPVNQRGKTSYTNSGYTLDRWISQSRNITITINDGYIRAESSVTNTLHIRQHINRVFKEETKLTFAVKARGVSFGLCYYGTGAVMKDYDDWTIVVYNYTVPAGTDLSVSPNYNPLFTWSNGGYVEVQWAALYEGSYTAETLPEYRCKGYGAELAECQRYYYRINGISDLHLRFGAGIVDPDGYVYGFISIPTNMRIKNVSISYAAVTSNCGDVTSTIKPVRAYASGSVIHITAETSLGVSGYPVILRLEPTTDAYIAFSADL